MPESWQYMQEWQGKDACIFALSLSPAQEFIEEARKSRDLRAGSLLLSWLSFKLYEPILQHYQEKAFIVPACAGNPFFEKWKKNNDRLELEQLKELASGGKSITNRAVGLIERDQLCLLNAAEENCRAAWNSYAAFCLQDEKLNDMPRAWRERWQQQMQDFSAAFSIYAVVDTVDLTNLPISI
ncbi:MAG TPA: type III-B CRISPR-associated protein Cas10/Cmr2, partial [Methylomicrobium sp.]|nr:type III-B CRISPR-associated protein Cas10/Cmr2 [Methylomicrobium sp.]